MLSRLGKKGAPSGPPGPDFQAIYDKLRASEMNQWVGGDDPEVVGSACAGIFLRHIPLVPGAQALDFGCGIGRVMLSLLRLNAEARITGFDIVPRMIAFNRETIAPHFPNVGFELLADGNVHYDRYKDDTLAKSREAIVETYGGRFEAAYAFSVFTHIDVNDFEGLLRFVGALLKPGGHLLFTAFVMTPFSRVCMMNGATLPKLAGGVTEEDGEVFIAQPDDRLAFIAYDMARLDRMIMNAGLVPCVVEYGNWRGTGLSNSFQDIIVCRKPV